MGLWLNQLYDVDDLRELDQNQQELLKNEIRKQLAYHPDIIRALGTEVDKFYKKLTGKDPKARPAGGY